MPLVVPGINNNSSSSNSPEKDDIDNWKLKLLGKTLGDEHSVNAFKRADLPAKSRVIGFDQPATTDHHSDRLSVRLDKEGTIVDVRYT